MLADGSPSGQGRRPPSVEGGRNGRSTSRSPDFGPPTAACDLENCGDGIIEGAEACDGASLGACPGSCRGDCTCDCTNIVADPKASVKLSTKKEAGQLGAKMLIALGAYAGEPVRLRLDDGDSQPIAQRSLGALPPSGQSGSLWRFKAKNGLQQVQLKSLAPKQPGMFQLIVKAKKWFGSTTANDTAANTRFTITSGNQCFVHAATKKTD